MHKSNTTVHDKNYTSSVVSLLVQKMGKEGRGTYLRGEEAVVLNFWLKEGVLISGGGGRYM